MTTPFLFFIAVFFSRVEGANQKDIFGVTVRWESADRSVEERLEKLLTDINDRGKEYLDPDCRWRKRTSKCENHYLSTTKELEAKSEVFRKETLGFFDIKYSKKYRDFGGVWQGYSLEQLQKSVEGSWLVDISGDILLSAPFKLQKPITITDPVFDSATYATVDINRGYVIASVSRGLGGKIITPNETKTHDDILKIVLFASPNFSGARVDAWATAIVAGGKKVLTHLESLEEFKEKWAYFYFEPNGTPHCARSLKCKLEGSEKTVIARF